MTERDILRDRLKAYFRMLAVHDPMRGNELVDVLDAYLDVKFKRPWVGLTDEEIDACIHENMTVSDPHLRDAVYGVVLSTEAKLKEKNNG